MSQNLTHLQSQLQQLETDLQSPNVFIDPKKLKEITKQYNELKEKIDLIKKIKNIEETIKSIEEMLLKEKDEEMIKISEEELRELEIKKKEIEKKLEEISSPKTTLSKKNIIVEIRAGVGGDEAELFVADLLRMYSRFAEKKTWPTTLLSSQPTGIGGLKEVIFEIKGEEVYDQLKTESGVHRVQRIPITEKSGRIHTSTATVAVLPEAEEREIKIDPKDLRIDTYRASGHGGQNVNKVSSAVRITHFPTNLVVACQDGRSQSQNKERAMTILRSRLLAQEKERIKLEEATKRQALIGTADRSEKIRTYNFLQSRITDHRLKKSWYNIEEIMDGELDKIIKEFKNEKTKEK